MLVGAPRGASGGGACGVGVAARVVKGLPRRACCAPIATGRRGAAAGRPALRGVAQTAAQKPRVDLGQLYTSQVYTPPAAQPALVRPAVIPGKGIGLESTAKFNTGDVIWIDHPLGVTYGPRSSTPTNEQLVQAILSAPASPTALEWLELLGADRGADAPADAVAAAAATAAALMERLGKGEVAGDAPPQDTTRIASVISNESVVSDAVACNSYGEDSEDAAVAELRETEPLAFTGLWPRLSLLNHSCVPNTSTLVVGGVVLLTAARRIAPGDELTTCYLGRPRFAHVAKRRALLASRYGFHCQCDRCLLEHLLFPSRRYPATDAKEYGAALDLLAEKSPDSPAAAPPGPLQWVLDKVYGRGRFRVGGAAEHNTLLQDVNILLEDSLDVAAQDALTALTKSHRKVRRVLNCVDGALVEVAREVSALKLSGWDERLVTAGVGRLLELRWELLQMSGLGGATRELDALRRCLRVTDAVARGTEAHMFLAVQAASRSRALNGPASDAARGAGLAAAAAHATRYGHGAPTAVLRRLMAARLRMAAGVSMASRMSVMAWEADREREGEDGNADGSADVGTDMQQEDAQEARG